MTLCTLKPGCSLRMASSLEGSRTWWAAAPVALIDGQPHAGHDVRVARGVDELSGPNRPRPVLSSMMAASMRRPRREATRTSCAGTAAPSPRDQRVKLDLQLFGVQGIVGALAFDDRQSAAASEAVEDLGRQAGDDLLLVVHVLGRVPEIHQTGGRDAAEEAVQLDEATRAPRRAAATAANTPVALPPRRRRRNQPRPERAGPVRQPCPRPARSLATSSASRLEPASSGQQ